MAQSAYTFTMAESRTGTRPMAVSNRLSRKLHGVFGSEAAQAMVDWMQRVDMGRTELRELNSAMRGSRRS